MEAQAIRMPSAWKTLLAPEFSKPYFDELANKVREDYISSVVYPPPQKIFRAFDICDPDDIKVVILGQDPYHTPGVADGLAFSTNSKNQTPPSLSNIFREIDDEFGVICNKDPNLTRWARQGVLLLNASLSVRKHEANSHANYGWHTFTDGVIAILSEQKEHIVFLLWGAFAGKKEVLIDWTKHHVLKSPHPSPLSAHRGFFGCGHFAEANEYLRKHNRGEIDWCS